MSILGEKKHYLSLFKGFLLVEYEKVVDKSFK